MKITAANSSLAARTIASERDWTEERVAKRALEGDRRVESGLILRPLH
jgi:hypothetical protein